MQPIVCNGLNEEILATPALHEDTLVHTARGLIAIRDVEPGDAAFALDQPSREIRPATVTARVDRGQAEVCVVQVGTRSIQATADTRLLALIDRRRPGRIRRRFRAEWTRVADLTVGDIVGVARKTPDLGTVQILPRASRVRSSWARSARLPDLADDDLMWWLGLYAGDGFVHHSGRERKRVEFAIPASQPDVREELIRVTKVLFDLDARAKDKWRVVVPGVRLADYVDAIGLHGKALYKRIPTWVFASPEAHRLAFLGGYVDADGSIRTPGPRGRNKDMGLTSANPDLLEDARRLAVSCGIRTSTVWDFKSRHPIDKSRWMTGYRMSFAGDFDRVSCRSERRILRMGKRRWFHTDTSVGGTTIRSHTSAWLGFARIEQIAAAGSATTHWVVTDRESSMVAESLIVGAG